MRRDVVRELVRVQQRAIRRGSRYWMAVAERLQTGDLAPDVWLKAYAEYAEAAIGDLTELRALFAGRGAADDEAKGGRTKGGANG